MNLKSLFKPKHPSARHKKVYDLISSMFGLRPRRLDLYLTALRHKSAARNIYNQPEISNERLEFLGDAVLDAAVAEYLYLTYPKSEEGELTQMKSRVVSRANLNDIARNIGVDQLIETDMQASSARSSLGGNAIEAVFGAIYLDRGYEATKKAIIKILGAHSELSTVKEVESDFKSRLYEEAHRQRVELKFVTRPGAERNGKKVFFSEVIFDSRHLGKGEGLSKKSAEQDASRKSLKQLNIAGD